MEARQLIMKIASKIKGEKYSIDYPFTFGEICSILLGKSISITRGFICIKPWLKKSKGLIFAEHGARVFFAHKINSGKNLNLMEYSRINALSYRGIDIGDNFTLGKYAIIECTGVLRDVGNYLKIGDNVGISHYCFISVRGEVVIGNNVIFGPKVCIFSENHNYNDLHIPIKYQGVTKETTIIGNDI